jgi:hypothetical protein
LFELSKLACRAGLDLRGTPERLEIAQPVHQWVPTGAGDTNVYRACQRAEERLREQGARIDRVVLDCELKRDYQRFLQEHNRGRKDSDGRPDRESEEIALWARQHDLPYYDEQVHFPIESTIGWQSSPLTRRRLDQFKRQLAW